MTNRELLEIMLFIDTMGFIIVFALLGYIIYRINQLKAAINLVARGITRLMGISGE